MAKVYGGFPTYNDNAYFLQLSCEWEQNGPEVCLPELPLHWERDSAAVLVYHARGTRFGTQTFDLTDWKSGQGGNWEQWSVQGGSLLELPGFAPDCAPTDTIGTDTIHSDTTTTGIKWTAETPELDLIPYPDRLEVRAARPILQEVVILDLQGRQLDHHRFQPPVSQASIPLSFHLRGMLFLQYHTTEGIVLQKWRRP
jgi:hypothetical protein